MANKGHSGWGNGTHKKAATPKAPASEAVKARRKAQAESIKALNDNRTRIFHALLHQQGLPVPVSEHRFWEGRRFAFDFAWPECRLALEMEGGVHTGGRHTTGTGFETDMEKYNHAACLGWRIIRCVPTELATMATVALVRRCLKG